MERLGPSGGAPVWSAPSGLTAAARAAILDDARRRPSGARPARGRRLWLFSAGQRRSGEGRYGGGPCCRFRGVIASLRLRDFKNFADGRLRMGPFTVLVGANASGKSNVRDALRFLNGVGRGYRLADTIGGKYGAGGQVEWDQLRGAADEIVRLGQQEFRLTVELRNYLQEEPPFRS